YGTRPEEPSEGEDEEIRWEVTESARVSVDRNGFDPIVVRVPFEAEIEFEIAATGDTDHRIVIDGLGVDVSVESGTSRTVTVRPTQSGVYHMYCALHSESNPLLHGRFIVERQQ
ncbi:MAG: cupredoxin domain-containing protein, partial [Bacillota bacterium]